MKQTELVDGTDDAVVASGVSDISLAEARRLVALFADVTTSKDVERFLGGFTDDCVVQFGHFPTMRGKQQLRPFVESMFSPRLKDFVCPEPCAVARKGGGEASVGGRAGQPLSRERTSSRDADGVARPEGNTNGRVSASARSARRGRRHWHVRKLHVLREPGGPMTGRCGVPLAVRIGKVRSRSR